MNKIKFESEEEFSRIVSEAERAGDTVKEVEHIDNVQYAVVVKKELTDIEKLQQENELLKVQNVALAEQANFHEDVLFEIILELHK